MYAPLRKVVKINPSPLDTQPDTGCSQTCADAIGRTNPKSTWHSFWKWQQGDSLAISCWGQWALATSSNIMSPDISFLTSAKPVIPHFPCIYLWATSRAAVDHAQPISQFGHEGWWGWWGLRVYLRGGLGLTWLGTTQNIHDGVTARRLGLGQCLSPRMGQGPAPGQWSGPRCFQIFRLLRYLRFSMFFQNLQND